MGKKFTCVYSPDTNIAIDEEVQFSFPGSEQTMVSFPPAGFLTSINEQLTNSGTLSICNPVVGSLISTTTR